MENLKGIAASSAAAIPAPHKRTKKQIKTVCFMILILIYIKIRKKKTPVNIKAKKEGQTLQAPRADKTALLRLGSDPIRVFGEF
jgi:hypothetical protein